MSQILSDFFIDRTHFYSHDFCI